MTSYGGNLKFTLRYEPVPGGLSSKNTSPDVVLVSRHNIELWYFKKETPLPTVPQTIEVPILEQYWQRKDGAPVNREHMLMALADLEMVLIKATYTTNTRSAGLISVSLDIADETNRGSFNRALEVEQCQCPEGYRGLSCENCDVGYRRSESTGLYLGTCEPCSCNGHSSECDAETGYCMNCADYTSGDYCDECLPGYEGDPSSPYGCRPRDNGRPQTCDCNHNGTVSDACYDGRCSCKSNVEGDRCDRCRQGTFAFSGSNPSGCTECYCSGVTDQCHDSNYYVEQIPVIVSREGHGFSLVDWDRSSAVDSDLDVDEDENYVGYRFPSGGESRKYWSLPSIFLGNKVASYGGSLAFTLRFESRGGRASPDQDVVIIGNGVTIFWTNPFGAPEPDSPNVSIGVV